jgi:Phospholipase B
MLVKTSCVAVLVATAIALDASVEDVLTGPSRGMKVHVEPKLGRKPSVSDLRPQQDDLMPASRFKELYTVRTSSYGSSGPAAAGATLQLGLNAVGWNTLEVESISSYDDDSQAYAAGFAEGKL